MLAVAAAVLVPAVAAQQSVPAPPTGLVASSVSHDSVTLAWDDPGDGSIVGYRVLRRDTVNQAPGSFDTVVENTATAATTYTDAGVSAGTRYVYRVLAINSVGTSGRSNYVDVQTPAAPAQQSVPAAPTGLAASSVAHDSVTLTWDDPGDGSIVGYRVLRRDTVNQAPGSFDTVEENTGTAATTYVDAGVSAGTRYVYRVLAINSAGTSGRSNYVNVETPAAPAQLTVPAAPTGLVASSVAHDSVTLTWDDPGDGSVAGYQVLRRSRDGDDYGDGLGAAGFAVVAEDTGSAAATYTDTSVEAHTRYSYQVKAKNAQGLSEASGDIDAETAEAPASPSCDNGFVAPAPVEVAVTAVPVEVESTAADYFVLFVSHEVGRHHVLGPGTTGPRCGRHRDALRERDAAAPGALPGGEVQHRQPGRCRRRLHRRHHRVSTTRWG